jgi:cytochrome c
MFAPQIWSWINQGMPLNQGFLTADEVYSLTAYLLHRNGIIEEDDILDADSLPDVRMPARGTFAYTPDHPAFAEWTPGMPRRRVR